MGIQLIIHYLLVTLVVAGVVFLVIVGIRKGYYLKNKKTHVNSARQVLQDIFIFYLISLYQITAVRYGLGLDKQNFFLKAARINKEPLKNVNRWIMLGRWWHLIYNVLGNCIWFIPLGFFVPLLYKKKRNALKIVTLGIVISSSIELLQLFLGTGVTDIDDIIFNALGTLMGYIIWKIVYNIYIKSKRQEFHK